MRVYKVICKKCGYIDFIKLTREEYNEIKQKGMRCPKCKNRMLILKVRR